jgi:hypothetical protein
MKKYRSPVLGFVLALGCSLVLVTSGYVQAYTTNSGAGTGILNMSGGTLTTGNFLVGHDFAGTTNLSGGTGTFNVNGRSFTPHNLNLTAAGLLGMLLWPDRRRSALCASFTMTEAPAADGTIPKADGIMLPILSP